MMMTFSSIMTFMTASHEHTKSGLPQKRFAVNYDMEFVIIVNKIRKIILEHLRKIFCYALLILEI